MTRAQVEAVVANLDAKIASFDADSDKCAESEGRALFRGRADGLSVAARILTEALAESETSPGCRAVGPRGVVCSGLHAPSMPHVAPTEQGTIGWTDDYMAHRG